MTKSIEYGDSRKGGLLADETVGVLLCERVEKYTLNKDPDTDRQTSFLLSLNDTDVKKENNIWQFCLNFRRSRNQTFIVQVHMDITDLHL